MLMAKLAAPFRIPEFRRVRRRRRTNQMKMQHETHALIVICLIVLDN